MDRRTFLTLTGITSMAIATPHFLKAEAADSPAANELLASARSFQQVGRVSQMQGNQLRAQVGNIALVVLRNANGSMSAFNRRCTHAGCAVGWQAGQNRFVCPCHNSQFGATGQVLQGPARSPLQSYPVRVQGDRILVRIDA